MSWNKIIPLRRWHFNIRLFSRHVIIATTVAIIILIVPAGLLIENWDADPTGALPPHFEEIMVGVGGRSKACDNCRRRRIKCGMQTTTQDPTIFR
jgi:hypothetical protein